MFPVEIWEEILKHVDPVDLMRLRRVCKSWNAMVPQILKKTDGWYKKCQEDIPRDYWSSILEHQHHTAVNWKDYEQARDNVHVWYSLYRSWMHWRGLPERPHSVQTHQPIPEHRPYETITCVATLSNMIAVGRSEGYITFYNIKENSISHVDEAVPIQDVQLWRNGADQIIVTSLSIDDRVSHWNLDDTCTEGHSMGSLISTSFEYSYTITDDVISIERPLTLRSENGENDEPKMLTVYRETLPDLGKPIAVCADGKEVMLWTDANYYVSFYTHSPNYYPEHGAIEGNAPEIAVRCYRIFKPCVISCIGELGEFGFSIGGRKWTTYNVFGRFYAPVTALLFHVRLLVLGLGSGEIHLFAVRDVECLESLNFDTIQSKKIRLDTNAIISLDPMEHDSIHYIVAATDRQLHVVKFDSM